MIQKLLTHQSRTRSSSRKIKVDSIFCLCVHRVLKLPVENAWMGSSSQLEDEGDAQADEFSEASRVLQSPERAEGWSHRNKASGMVNNTLRHLPSNAFFKSIRLSWNGYSGSLVAGSARYIIGAHLCLCRWMQSRSWHRLLHQ